MSEEDSRIGLKNNGILPEYFRPLLWSYDFSLINPQKSKRTIIVNTINYGDLKHWRWIVQFYGREEVRKTLIEIPATEISLRTRRLASLIFDIDKFNYAPRGFK